MKLVTLFLCLVLTGCLHFKPKLPGGTSTFVSTPTNTTFNVTPPDDGAAPTTQSFSRTISSTNIVPSGVSISEVTTNFLTNGAVSSVVHKTSVPAPPLTNVTVDNTTAGSTLSNPRVDTTKALQASYSALRPLQICGIALIVLGIIGGSMIAFLLKWPTLGLKLGGVTAASGAALLVFYKVLASVSPTVLFLSVAVVVLGILALVFDHFHVFSSGKLAVHEADPVTPPVQ